MNLTTEKTGGHYLSEDNTVLNTTPDGGKRDSLGRTARAAVIYENVDYLDVYLYFSYGQGLRMNCYRYPRHIEPICEEYNSRDHVVIALSCLIETGYDFDAGLIASMRPRTSTGYTPSQLLFFKAIRSNFWSWVYLIYKMPGLTVLIPAWNWFWRAVSGTLKTYKSPLLLKFYMFKNNIKPTKWQKFCFKLTMKTFAIFYTVYEIRGIKSEAAKRILLKAIRINIEKHNYVLRALTGQKVTAPEYYIPSRKNRWSLRLDITCDRDMTEYPLDTPENNMELGMLKYYCG